MFADDREPCRSSQAIQRHDDRHVRQVDEPCGRRPVQRKEIVPRGDRRQPFRIHPDETSGERTRDKSPDGDADASDQTYREWLSQPRFGDDGCDAQPYRKPHGGRRVDRSTERHERPRDDVPAAQERDNRERTDCKRQLPRMKVAFECICARTDDRVPQGESGHQCQRRPLRAIERRADEERGQREQRECSQLQHDEGRRQPYAGRSRQRAEHVVHDCQDGL